MNYEEARKAPAISGDAPDALERVKERLAAYREEHRRRMAINDYFKKHKTLEGCPELMPGEQEYLDSIAEYAYRGRCVPFRKKDVDNMLGSIRALNLRVQELEAKKVDPPPEGWIFDGGKVVINTESNRIQVLLDERPDRDMVQRLRLCGFRYIPLQRAWEKQYTNSSLQKTKEFFKKC